MSSCCRLLRLGHCPLYILGCIVSRIRNHLSRSHIRSLRSHDTCHERVLHIYSDIVHGRHLAVEVHSAAHRRHLAVTTHELALSDQDRSRILTKIVSLHIILVLLREHSLEDHRKILLFSLRKLRTDLLLLGDEVVNAVRVDTCKTCILDLHLEEIHEMAVKLAIHKEHIIPLRLGCLDERILSFWICRIKTYDLLVLVSLLALNGLLVVLDAEILAVCILQETELHSPVAELLV